jgi:hypothetical protein
MGREPFGFGALAAPMHERLSLMSEEIPDELFHAALSTLKKRQAPWTEIRDPVAVGKAAAPRWSVMDPQCLLYWGGRCQALSDISVDRGGDVTRRGPRCSSGSGLARPMMGLGG